MITQTSLAVSAPALGVIFAVAACALFGVADFMAATSSRKSSPFLVSSYLYLFEIPLLFIPFFYFGDFGELGENLLLIGAGSLSLMAYLAFIYGLTHGKVAIVGSFTGIFSLVIPAIASIAMGESTSKYVWLGLVMSFLAVAFISQETRHQSDTLDLHAKYVRISIMFGVLSGLGFGAYYVALGAIDAPVQVRLSYITLPGIVFAIYWLWRTQLHSPQRSSNHLRKSALGFIALTALLYETGQFFYPLSSDRISLVATNIIVNLYPGLTIILARMKYHERTNKVQNAGFLVAIVGVVFVGFGVS